MKTTCSKLKAQNVNDNNATAPDALASQPWITLDDVTGDIERMIGILVTPYVDDSMLSLDDEEASLQVGSLDPSFRKMEFIEELDHLLTPDERNALRRLTECYWMDSQQGIHPWSDTQLRDTVTSIWSKARGLMV